MFDKSRPRLAAELTDGAPAVDASHTRVLLDQLVERADERGQY
jgi:hypothetical protein